MARLAKATRLGGLCIQRSLPAIVAFFIGITASTVVARHAQSPMTEAPRPPEPNAANVPPTPAQQAQLIGLGQCAAMLDLMSRKTLTGAYDQQSGWSRADPVHHVFQSVAAVNRPANEPPDALTALIAAPVTSGGCDGVAVQVFPLPTDCQSAQKIILQGGKTLAPLLTARIMQDISGNRLILLPGHMHTCIAVAVDSNFGSSSK